jgi:hypothetical protein
LEHGNTSPWREIIFAVIAFEQGAKNRQGIG